MQKFKNSTSKEEFTLLNNYQTQSEWVASDYMPERGELVYCRDVVSGISLWGSKIGDGINQWKNLGWFVPPTNNNYRPITSIHLADFLPSSDGTIYTNPDFKGLLYKIFSQDMGRFLNTNEIQFITSGGFMLINNFRIYEEQELIAIF